jgi:hypothetical protein
LLSCKHCVACSRRAQPCLALHILLLCPKSLCFICSWWQHNNKLVCKQRSCRAASAKVTRALLQAVLCSSQSKRCPASTVWPAEGVRSHILQYTNYWLCPESLPMSVAAGGSMTTSWSASSAAVVQPAREVASVLLQAVLCCSQSKRCPASKGWPPAGAHNQCGDGNRQCSSTQLSPAATCYCCCCAVSTHHGGLGNASSSRPNLSCAQQNPACFFYCSCCCCCSQHTPSQTSQHLAHGLI